MPQMIDVINILHCPPHTVHIGTECKSEDTTYNNK